MHEHPGWVTEPDKHGGGKVSGIPAKLYDLRNAVVPIYRKEQSVTTDAANYFSPQEMDREHKHSPHTVEKANVYRNRLLHAPNHEWEKSQVYLETGDDFEFFRYTEFYKKRIAAAQQAHQKSHK